MNDNAEFRAFLPKLAVALGGKITRQSEDDRYAVIELPGVTIDVSTQWREPGKLRVGVPTLHYRDAQGNEQRINVYDVRWQLARDDGSSLQGSADALQRTHEIHVSMARGAEVVARDIRRRQLPGATRAWALMCVRRDEALAYSNKTDATAAKLAKVLGVAARSKHGDSDSVRFNTRAVTVTAQGDSVRFEHFSVSADVAVKLLALLARELPKEEQE